MADLIEVSNWESGIFKKELTSLVLGGTDTAPANTQALQLANRTLWIKDILKFNSIFIEPMEYERQGQNFIHDVVFDASVVHGDFVYYNVGNAKFYRAIEVGTGTATKVIGMADRDTYDRVIIDGVLPTILSATSGDHIYLSASQNGKSTTTNTGVYLGYFINAGIMRLSIRDYIPIDPVAATPGLRTLGTGVKQACAGNDLRLEHTGAIYSDAAGVTSISTAVVNEYHQVLSNVATHNISTSKHGYVPKGIAGTSHYLRCDGSWFVPTGVAGFPPIFSTSNSGSVPSSPTGGVHFIKSNGSWSKVSESTQALTNVTTFNFSTAKHGYVPRATSGTTNFLRCDGSWAVPPGSGASIPTGGIIMWSGSISSIPSGWYLCNGANGTPNLIDRFVVQVATSSTNPGSTGGADSHVHDHTGWTKGRAISLAEMPYHSHGILRNNFGGSTFAPSGDVDNKIQSGSIYQGTIIPTGGDLSGNTVKHYHEVYDETIPTIPKFYALAYIMKG